MSVSLENDNSGVNLSFYDLPPEEQAKYLTLQIRGRVTSPEACKTIENRIREPDYNLYCWFGRIRKGDDPDRDGGCAVGQVCSPVDFTDARNRFCLTLGCDPFKYVDDPFTEVVSVNRRGGI